MRWQYWSRTCAPASLAHSPCSHPCSRIPCITRSIPCSAAFWRRCIRPLLPCIRVRAAGDTMKYRGRARRQFSFDFTESAPFSIYISYDTIKTADIGVFISSHASPVYLLYLHPLLPCLYACSLRPLLYPLLQSCSIVVLWYNVVIRAAPPPNYHTIILQQHCTIRAAAGRVKLYTG